MRWGQTRPRARRRPRLPHNLSHTQAGAPERPADPTPAHTDVSLWQLTAASAAHAALSKASPAAYGSFARGSLMSTGEQQPQKYRQQHLSQHPLRLVPMVCSSVQPGRDIGKGSCVRGVPGTMGHGPDWQRCKQEAGASMQQPCPQQLSASSSRQAAAQEPRQHESKHHAQKVHLAHSQEYAQTLDALHQVCTLALICFTMTDSVEPDQCNFEIAASAQAAAPDKAE